MTDDPENLLGDDRRHTHNWRPLPTWGGRYRCIECGVFGYRKSATSKNSTDDEMYEYHCPCGQPAIAREFYLLRNGCFSSKKIWRCATHRTEKDDIVVRINEDPR